MIKRHFSGNHPTNGEQALCQIGASIQLIEILPVMGAGGKYPRRDQRARTAQRAKSSPPRRRNWLNVSAKRDSPGAIKGFKSPAEVLHREQGGRGEEAKQAGNDPRRVLGVGVIEVFRF